MPRRSKQVKKVRPLVEWERRVLALGQDFGPMGRCVRLPVARGFGGDYEKRFTTLVELRDLFAALALALDYEGNPFRSGSAADKAWLAAHWDGHRSPVNDACRECDKICAEDSRDA